MRWSKGWIQRRKWRTSVGARDGRRLGIDDGRIDGDKVGLGQE